MQVLHKIVGAFRLLNRNEKTYNITNAICCYSILWCIYSQLGSSDTFKWQRFVPCEEKPHVFSLLSILRQLVFIQINQIDKFFSGIFLFTKNLKSKNLYKKQKRHSLQLNWMDWCAVCCSLDVSVTTNIHCIIFQIRMCCRAPSEKIMNDVNRMDTQTIKFQ